MTRGHLTDLSSMKELQDKLIKFLNLTNNEARLYCAMLQGFSFTAGELSCVTDIHRSRIYDNLRGLAAKKLIEQISMDPLRFSVLPPKSAVVVTVSALEDEHRIRIQEMMTLGLTLDAVYRGESKRDTASDIRTIALDDSVFELSKLLENAKERVWVSKHASGGIIDWFVLRTHLDRLSMAGVDMRFLSDRPVRVGYKSRIHAPTSLSYALIDHVSVTFFLPKAKKNEGQMMISSNTEYVTFLEQVFSDHWDQGIDDLEDM